MNESIRILEKSLENLKGEVIRQNNQLEILKKEQQELVESITFNIDRIDQIEKSIQKLSSTEDKKKKSK